jgi:hypothetical protein
MGGDRPAWIRAAAAILLAGAGSIHSLAWLA